MENEKWSLFHSRPDIFPLSTASTRIHAYVHKLLGGANPQSLSDEEKLLRTAGCATRPTHLGSFPPLSNLNGDSLGSGVRLRFHLLCPYLLAEYACLSLSFPICKMETIISALLACLTGQSEHMF